MCLPIDYQQVNTFYYIQGPENKLSANQYFLAFHITFSSKKFLFSGSNPETAFFTNAL